MGYMVHHAIVVTGYDEHIQEAHAAALKVDKAAVSDLTLTQVNGYQSFFVGPDGSKEGWKESDEGDTRRDAIVKAIDKLPVSWAELTLGDEYGPARIVRESGVV